MGDLIERIDARLKGQVLPSRAMTIEIRDELSALRERVAVLEHTLIFYADRDIYSRPRDACARIDYDMGNKARAILAK